MTEVAPQLDYAPRPKVSGAVRARRVAIVAGALLLLAGAVWVMPPAVRRMQVVYWQSRCMRYTTPADQLVHMTDPAVLPRLLAPGSGYDGSLRSGHAFFVPAVYRDYVGNVTASQSLGVAFLHRRRSINGRPRLVVVNLRKVGLGTPKVMMFVDTVIQPGGVIRGPRDLGTSTSGRGAVLVVQPGDTLRVYAGRPDPSDESHFTIDYALNGDRYTLDGWLKDDGSVLIEKRD